MAFPQVPLVRSCITNYSFANSAVFNRLSAVHLRKRAMKKYIPALLLLTLLAACSRKADPPQKEPIHFAALMVADDLLAKGANSDYAAFLPAQLQPANYAMDAQKMILEYAEDPEQTGKRYLERLHNKLQMDGSVAVGTAYSRDQFEYVASGVDKIKGHHYTVKLHAEFDRDFYKGEAYPKVREKSEESVICRGAQGGLPIYIQRTGNHLLVEAYFTKCVLTRDVVKNHMTEITTALESSLGDIYAGKTPVNVGMASYLAGLYASGTKLPASSPCLTGTHAACMQKLDKRRLVTDEAVKKERLSLMQIAKENEEKK